MRIESAACGVALTFLLGGCAIHPQVKDVTGVPTYEIVQRIRCETRQAVIESALAYLTKSPDVDPASREIGKRFDPEFTADPDSINNLNPNLFKGQVHDILNVFWTTGVAYNYTLEMTEINNVDGNLNLASVLTGPFDALTMMTTGTTRTFGLNFSAGFDRTRKNTRTFTITDNFGGLVQTIKPMYCTGRLVGENYIYPIAGRIGVDEMVHAFVKLSLFGNLASESTTSGEITKGPPTLVDTLEFTTMISGGVNPTVNFMPIGKTLSVMDANLLNTTASRMDKHQVIVGLALEEAAQAQLGSVRAGFQGQPRLFGSLLTASGKNPAERAAATAVDQFLTRQLFSPTINIPR